MKSYNRFQSLFLALSAIASTTVIAVPQAKAVSFQEQQVSQDQFAVVAVPFGYKEHRLEIIEQVADKEQCWSESGTTPVKVDLLLLDFDHTDSCRRVINTNGYTLRLDGEDERIAHVVKIVQDQGELKLIAFHKDASQPNIEIGSTNGLSDGAMKIVLNPGWQISKRVHKGKTIDHLYLSGNTSGSGSYSTSTSTTTVNGNTSSTSTTTSTQGSGTDSATNIDTKTLVNNIDQIYQNLVTPILRNLSEEEAANK